MAINLTATAKLNTAPFVAGINRLKTATMGLSTTQSAANAKAVSEVKQQQAARQAASVQRNSTVKQMTALENAAHAQQMSNMRQGLSAQRYLYGDMARMTARAALGLAALPTAAAAAGIAWERSFADVIRTADPAFSESEKSVAKLRQSMVELVQTMPTSWGDVTEIATMANQMGIASTETAAFTEAVAMFAATSGVSAEVAATAFGRLRTIVPAIGSDFMGLADSILKVGVNSVATEAEIINIVTQISSIAGAAAFSDKEMIGLAGAMASVRIPPELSRGVVTRVFGQMSRAVSDGGASLEGFAKIAGMSGREFADSWGREGESGRAFVSFMQGLKELGPAAEAELRGLGITSVRDVPVMLRLANAADSEGVMGNLLTQTINDAENAAGETQRQYTEIAETVASKLKMLGNNLMAFFDAASRSSLGPIGNVLDFLSSGLKDVTNGMDDAHKLFGKFEMPFTNGDLIGWGALAAAAVAGLLAIGSAALKAREALAGLQLLSAATGMGGVADKMKRQWASVPAVIVGGMDKSEKAVRRGSVMMTAHGRQVAAVNRDIARAVDARNASMMRTGRESPADAALTRQAANTRALVVASKEYGVSARSAAGQAALSFSRAGNAVRAAGSMMGAAAGVAFGPWGILAGVAIAAIAGIVSSTRAASTEAGDLAQAIANAGDDTARAVKHLNEIKVGGLFGREVQVFKEGYASLKDMTSAMKELQDLQTKPLLDNPGITGGVAAGLQQGNIQKQKQLAKDYAATVEIIDAAYGELASGGNATQAMKVIRDFTGSSQEMFTMISSPEAKNMANDFEAAFEFAKVDFNAENLERLYKGQLPAVQSALMGVALQAGVTAAEFDSLEGGEVAFAALADSAEKAAAAFINYGAAAQTAGGGVASLTEFTNNLKEQIASQEAWGQNLAELAKFGSQEAVQAFIDGGIELAPYLDGMVKNFKETGGDINAQWKDTMDTVVRSTETSAGLLGPAMTATMGSLRDSIRDAGLADAIAQALDDDQLTTFSRAIEGLGQDTAQQLARGILDKKYTVDQAIDIALASSRPRTIDVKAELDKTAIKNVNDSLQKFAQSEGVAVDVAAELNIESTVGDLRNMLGKPDLLPKIPADLSLVDAYAQYDSMRNYMIANGVDMDLEVHANQAYLRVENFKAYAGNETAMTMLDAMSAPAEGKLWEFVTLADGQIVVAEIDAETGMATGKVKELDTTAEKPTWKTVDAKTGQAQEAIGKIDALAEARKTKNINVTDNGTAASVQTAINSIQGRSVTVTVNKTTVESTVKQADGGVMQYYANGGVRENHIAQIAPAGTMRMWAEPETGGEAYIPLAKSKRLRSTAILEDVANRFGMALTPQNYTKYADGGQYNAQLFSRARYAGATSQRGDSPVDERRDIKMTFVNPVVRDPFKDAWERTQELGVRL